MTLDPSTTKYMIKAKIVTEGVVEKPDVVGAIFGQTEGLISNELDLRDLQKSGRIGRIEVELKLNKGKTEGIITIPSSLDQVETAILAAALETIDRVGPCKAKIEIEDIEDVRVAKRQRIIERAKELLAMLIEKSKTTGIDITDSVRQAVQVEEIIYYGPERLPAGPNIETSDTIIIVEGRNDVLNLLQYGIKNAIAVEGTNVPKTIEELSKEKIAIAFVDGDRGGELILKELLQVAEIDFVARAPRGREVEEISQKQIMKSLRNKIPVDQYIDMYNLNIQPKKDDSDSPAKTETKSNGNSSKASNGNGSKEQSEATAAQDKAQNGDVSSFIDMLKNLQGKAAFLDSKKNVVTEIPVREVREHLSKKPSNVEYLVFDGIITQPIVDLAAKAGIKMIVGVRKGNVSKVPPSVQLFTKADYK